MSRLSKISGNIFKVILVASFSLLFSCGDKDAEPSPVEQMPACQVTRIVINDTETKFEYDDGRQLIKFIGPYDNYIKFEYKDDRLETLTYYYGNDESNVIDVDKIEYNTRGQWSTHTSFDHQDSAVYDDIKNRIKIINKTNNRLYTTYVFEYFNGNLTRQTKSYYEDDGSLSYTTHYTYEYDKSKENRLAHFESLVPYGYASVYRLGQEPTPSRHMVKTVSTLLHEGSAVTIANYEYEYNDKGFPLKITVFGDDLNGDGEQTSSDTLAYSYHYDCF